ncbi:unnamed protein product [Rotaria sp. Silwood1]|nr:unnamed protein product [Rotaria sp. Silwood1]
MNLALYSRQSAGKKDLLRSVRRTITTELEKTFMCQITCELCYMDLNYTSDLFIHLSSSQHRELVRQLQLIHL